VPHDPGLVGDGSLANAGHMDSTGPASVIPYPCATTPSPASSVGSEQNRSRPSRSRPKPPRTRAVSQGSRRHGVAGRESGDASERAPARCGCVVGGTRGSGVFHRVLYGWFPLGPGLLHVAISQQPASSTPATCTCFYPGRWRFAVDVKNCQGVHGPSPHPAKYPIFTQTIVFLVHPMMMQRNKDKVTFGSISANS
jgi:hypothetical protein